MDLNLFFELVEEDARIAVSHISLYLALRNEWELQQSPDSMLVERTQVMRKAKIAGRSTYFRCMHDLHDAGYIRYEPGFGAEKSRLRFRRLG